VLRSRSGHRPRKLARSLLVVVLWPQAHGAELTIRVDNIPEGGGRVMIQVLGSRAAFDGEEPPDASAILPAIAPGIEITTTALPPGTYGVRVMHDRNGNGELDTNLMGIPDEPWGFSNNAQGTLGPPGWDAVRFDLEGDVIQDIRLNR